MTDKSIAFVADGQIPASPPPSSAIGPVKWVKDNLFPGPLNSILTVVSLLVIGFLLYEILPWLVDSSWRPEEMSLKGCRAEASGACFAVLVERIWQFIFGFYPAELYWRPTLAFLLLIVALAPVLVDRAPRKMFVFTAIYPLIGFFLIWGGSIWPLVAFFGLAACAWAVIKTYSTALAGAHMVNNVVVTLGALISSFGLGLVLIPLIFGGFGLVFSIVGLGFGNQMPSIVLYPLALMIAIGIAILVYQVSESEAFESGAAGVVVGVLLFLVALYYLYGPISSGLDSAFGFVGLEPVPSDKLGGFMLSMIIGIVGIAASLPIGIALALGRQSNLLIVKAISVGFIEAIRGVPLITLLFVASVLLNYFLPKGTQFDIILRVCIMVTLFSSAYMAEVIRGGIAALPKGQYEAADAMGLTYGQSMRLIILPQALKISIPNIVSSFIGLFKDTTLVIVIGLLDPLGLISTTRADANWNGIVWELYGFVALFFFIFCFGMSRYSQYLERKLATDHR